MAKHKPWAEFPVSKIGTYPQYYVSTEDTKHLKIIAYKSSGLDGLGFIISRQKARMLVKRINQCLDDTK